MTQSLVVSQRQGDYVIDVVNVGCSSIRLSGERALKRTHKAKYAAKAANAAMAKVFFALNLLYQDVKVRREIPLTPVPSTRSIEKTTVLRVLAQILTPAPSPLHGRGEQYGKKKSEL